MLDEALAFLFAPGCAACGVPLTRPSRSPVCDACWLAIPALASPCCARCGSRVQAPHVDCRCDVLPAGVDWLRSVGAYEGSLQAILHALKYDGRQTLAQPLAALAAEALRDLPPAGHTWAVPVPLHARKRRARGFNQAELLARGLPLPVRALLCRRRDTPSQTTLDRSARRQNVQGVFALRTGRWLPGRPAAPPAVPGDIQALLIDDVMTTGATLASCAAVLREAGVTRVAALTIARTV